MTFPLTQNLELIAAAPTGLDQIRQLVIDLAVRGRLIAQTSTHAHAEQLLAASRKGRQSAMELGLIKKEKAATEVATTEEPFRLPEGWAWCRVVDTGCYINGLAFKPSDWSSSGRPIIRIQNLSGRNSEFNRTTREVDASVVVRRGDILVSWSATLDAFVWEGEEGVLNQHIFRVEPSGAMNKRYLYWLMKWVIRSLADSDHSHGLVMAHINRGPFLAHPVALPPVEEQALIATRIDELMALCDRLEAEQADAEAAHAKLVEALLASLTQARDAADFRASWQQLAEHFHTLFTAEASVDALKQTVMLLGVSGRLTACDQSFADAPECSIVKPLWEAAHGWVWRTLGEVLESGIQNGISPKAASAETPVRCLTLSATTRGKFNASCFKYVDLDEEVAEKYRLQPGDLLVQRANSIDYVGVSAVYDGEAGSFIFPDLMMRMRAGKLVSVEFLHLCLAVEPSRAYMRANATGTQGNMPKVNQGTVSGIPVPVPPLESQHRIVSKVNELLAVCDQLKLDLVQARQQHEHLASVLVEQAVA